MGADGVGMSTVVEAIAAREAGMERFGLSVLTTREGTGEVIDPAEVLAVASAAATELGQVLTEVVGRWSQTGV